MKRFRVQIVREQVLEYLVDAVDEDGALKAAQRLDIGYDRIRFERQEPIAVEVVDGSADVAKRID